jgi:hypothetical protein
MVIPRIFISHSAKELGTKNFLEKLSIKLKEEPAFDVLVDKERLTPGSKWRDEIYTWMGLCHGAVILLSRNLLFKKLFCWDEIPRNDTAKLIYFLSQRFGLEWIKTAKIEKINGDKTIQISNGKNLILMKLNEEKARVNVEIDDFRTDDFILMTGENRTLEIYEEGSIWVPRESSILLWRQTLDPNFIIIPVYLGIKPEDLKQQKLFNDLNLTELQGSSQGSTEEMIEEIKKMLLGKLGSKIVKTDLEKIADQISFKLNEANVPLNIIDDASVELNIDLGPWRPMDNKSYSLALSMLHAGLEKSQNPLVKMRPYITDPAIAKAILDLIDPFWVDVYAARWIPDCAMQKDSRSTIILNANNIYSAKMYVRRASFQPPCTSWDIFVLTEKYGLKVVDGLIKEIEEILITGLLSRMEPTKENLRIRLERMAQKRKPVFIVLKYSKEVMKFLPELQNAFPLITFFILSGDKIPPQEELIGVSFKILEPHLPDNKGNEMEMLAQETYDSLGLNKKE